MKNWTKKFLKRKSESPSTLGNIFSNAKSAMKFLNIPEKLYIELSKKFSISNLRMSITNKETAFMAGFVAGWVEKGRKIK